MRPIADSSHIIPLFHTQFTVNCIMVQLFGVNFSMWFGKKLGGPGKNLPTYCQGYNQDMHRLLLRFSTSSFSKSPIISLPDLTSRSSSRIGTLHCSSSFILQYFIFLLTVSFWRLLDTTGISHSIFRQHAASILYGFVRLSVCQSKKHF